MVLEIEIEHNACVCQSCQILLMRNEDATTTTTTKIILTIGSGNVFHPNAQLIIIPPSSKDQDSGGEIRITIGTNNLFEEGSKSILDLSRLDGPKDDGDGDNDNAGPKIYTIIGSYNQISAGAQLKFESIGSANIFHPKCNLIIPVIKNGNMFQACCKLHVTGDKDKDHYLSNVVYQEKVCYLLGEVDPVQKMRNHTNGVKRNISDVSLLLNVSRRVVEKYHKLMPVKSYS